MILNNFYIKVFIRVTFIVLSCVVLGIVLQHLNHGYYYTLAGMIFLILLQTWLLINQVNRTNKDLERFLSSVQDRDSSIRFSENDMNSSFRKLHDRMNYLTAIIQQVEVENERTRHFLQSVVDHVNIGLLSYDTGGRIEICNNTAEKYLGVRKPVKLSALKTVNEELYKIISAIRPGQEFLHRMSVDDLSQSLLVKGIELKFENNTVKLVSLEDITSELNKKELDSWQQLIRVLTHEIMNSLSPIISLSTVISGYFKNKDDKKPVLPGKINHQIISKTLSGLNTIEETGKGLSDFVHQYRSLTLLPKPDPGKFTVNELFRKCKLLMGSTLSDNIKIIINVNPADISLVADYAQIEQVLINLIKNAIEALHNRKNATVRLNAFNDEDGILIQVEDNGKGIPEAIIGDIFVPFYTTKENGSGIGLSLSKQIMQNHNGTISVNSVPNKGTRFTLKFQL